MKNDKKFNYQASYDEFLKKNLIYTLDKFL